MSKELENQKLNYVTQGDYCLPCIRTKEQNELHIGVWANRHRQYLKQHHRIRYYNLLTSERLYHYLADIEEQAEARKSPFPLYSRSSEQKRQHRNLPTLSRRLSTHTVG